MSVLKGIDVSYSQGTLTQTNWNSIKNGSETAPPIDFAIIKASQADFIDPQFINNITCASNTGIMIGVYHYFTATTVSEAQDEADEFISVTAPYRDKINLWYSIDIEDANVIALDNATFYNVVMAFINRLGALNLPVMLYGGDTMFNKFETHLSYIVNTYAIWYARWWEDGYSTWTYPTDGTDRPGINGRTVFYVDGQPYSDYKIWQFGKSNSTYVSGVNSDVDVNFGYFEIPPTPPVEHSDEIVFHKVLDSDKPISASDERQHIYFTADSTGSITSNLYVSRKSDKKIIPVIFGETGNITIDINSQQSIFTFKDGLLETYTPPTPTPQVITVGSIVQIIEGATYTDGTPVPSSCIGVNYTVADIGESYGVQAALLQELYSWVALEYLVLQS